MAFTKKNSKKEQQAPKSKTETATAPKQEKKEERKLPTLYSYLKEKGNKEITPIKFSRESWMGLLLSFEPYGIPLKKWGEAVDKIISALEGGPSKEAEEALAQLELMLEDAKSEEAPNVILVSSLEKGLEDLKNSETAADPSEIVDLVEVLSPIFEKKEISFHGGAEALTSFIIVHALAESDVRAYNGDLKKKDYSYYSYPEE